MSSDQAIKAIETVYRGYRFRSRLEARYAVFLDVLRIKWEYELEGFQTSVGGYLPDFWLPDFAVWLELKGQEPNEQDMAKMLAFTEALDNDVSARFAAAVKEACDKTPALESLLILSEETKASLYALNEALRAAHTDNPEWQVGLNDVFSGLNSMRLGLRSMLDAINVRPQAQDLLLCIGVPWVENGAPSYLMQVADERHLQRSLIWMQCPECKDILHGGVHIPVGTLLDNWCGRCGVECVIDSPDLLNAYYAARQARFEFGETPR